MKHYISDIARAVLDEGRGAIDDWLIEQGVNKTNFNDFELKAIHDVVGDPYKRTFILYRNTIKVSQLTVDLRMIIE